MTREDYIKLREKLTTMHANHGGDIAEVAYMYELCREVFRYVEQLIDHIDDSMITPEECKARCFEVYCQYSPEDVLPTDFKDWYAEQYEKD